MEARSATHENNLVAIGFVVGSVTAIVLNPYEEFQRYKTIRRSGRSWKAASARLRCARPSPRAACNRCPRSRSPRLPHRDHAGFLNASRIKGSMPRSNRACSPPEAAFDAIKAGAPATNLPRTPCVPLRAVCTTSCTAPQLQTVVSKGLYTGTLRWVSIRSYRGKAPWPLHHDHADPRR